ncbi:MAG: DUF808 domain-containing protein, partial [Rhodobacteraceae bacterium]|nr:DUF808 domain-containing protein [Paracoccaceae bacterium]
WPALYDWIHHVAEAAAQGAAQWTGFVKWGVTALMDGVFGLALGAALIPLGTRIVAPVWARVSKLNPLI